MISWQQAAEAYIEAVQTRRRPRTLQSFRSQLPRFVTQAGLATPAELLPQHLTSYLNSLLARSELKPATAWGYFCRLLPFFRWLAQREIIIWDPTTAFRIPRFVHQPKRVKSRAEVQRFLEAPSGEDASAKRNRVMLEFFYGTGLRVGEVHLLDVGDVQLAAKQVQVRQSKTEPRLVPMGPRLSELLQIYLTEIRPQLLTDPAEPALWVSKLGKRITYAGLGGIFRRLGRRVELSMSPHELRHAFATHILKAGASLRIVQALLGHKSLLATQIYTQLSAQDVLREFRRTHPRARRKQRAELH